MERIRLTSIALDLPPAKPGEANVRLETGVVLVVGEDIPADLAEARVAAGTATIVTDEGDMSPAVSDGVAAFLSQLGQLQTATRALLDLVEGGTDADAVAVFEQLKNPIAPPEDLWDRMDVLSDRVKAAREAQATKPAKAPKGSAKAGA